MTYNPNIPQGSDNLSLSRVQILNNFSQLNILFDKDHYSWNDPTSANRGYHRQITFPSTPTIVPPTGTASILYPKLISGVPVLYFDNVNGSSSIWRGGSGNGAVGSVTGGNASNGRIIYPNGIIDQWGFINITGDSQTINFPVAFPNACFNIQLVGVRSDNQVRSLYVQPGFTRTSFVLRTNAGSMQGMWRAIGN
jgi:hypothetical protein